MITRRKFLRWGAAAGALAAMERVVPSYARPVRAARRSGGPIELTIRRQTIQIGGRDATAMAINGTVPGPLVRLREGEDAHLWVTNEMSDQTASIHWHGILLPFQMDGVPGVAYAGIRPGETFKYHFRVRQNGTYWYHSHSAGQEQLGVYGPMIIEPAERDPVAYDREYVVMLGDWIWLDPSVILGKLKKQSNYSNYQRRTVVDFFRDASQQGFGAALQDRLTWGKMQMDPTDIVDITGYHYTYLMNGLAPASNWTALFRPGERVRLRFINSAADSFFDVRIPGLPLTVVQADGQNVKPVTVDEFRIGIAETYDVIVRPNDDRAYTIFAESMDRSGFARGTLAPREGMQAAIPQRRKPPVRSMADMGMGMTAMDKRGRGGEMSRMDMPETKPSHGSESSMQHDGSTAPSEMSEMKRPQENAAGMHGPDKHGPGNQAVAMLPQNRLSEGGVGLEDAPWRVLVYTDLESLEPGRDQRAPERELEIHATGNMQRYMWSFDGKKYSEATPPIRFYFGERLRWTWVNDTMMEHPLHLHGMFMELDNGRGAHRPRKHTIVLKPGEKLSVIITADEPGVWAFHCHVLYHMEVGMFRVVSVEPRPA